MPLAVLEAMAAGVCILATDHEGISDVVKSGHNGVLTPEHDEQALARALSLLAQHPETRRAYGRAGRATVAESFSDAVWIPAKRALLGLSGIEDER
jgi:colanic acid/amylovoran biosynthesis glycosyltransferase